MESFPYNNAHTGYIRFVAKVRSRNDFRLHQTLNQHRCLYSIKNVTMHSIVHESCKSLLNRVVPFERTRESHITYSNGITPVQGFLQPPPDGTTRLDSRLDKQLDILGNASMLHHIIQATVIGVNASGHHIVTEGGAHHMLEICVKGFLGKEPMLLQKRVIPNPLLKTDFGTILVIKDLDGIVSMPAPFQFTEFSQRTRIKSTENQVVSSGWLKPLKLPLGFPVTQIWESIPNTNLLAFLSG